MPHRRAGVFFPDAAAVTEWPPNPVPVPAQSRAQEGHFVASGARLHFWETGGNGPAIILLHPATGSDQIWSYQQPVFAAAGYRVIAYSRRGYSGSDSVDTTHPGTAAGDLHALVQHLRLQTVHLLGCAAGGGIALDYALSHPDFVRSVTVACAVGGIIEPDYAKRANALRPKGFEDMPAAFRELSPWYRAANPEGAAIWERLENSAVTGNRSGQEPENRITWAALSRLNAPVLVLGGGADLYAPSPLLRSYAAHIPNAELLILPEGGHSLYWEMPELFNATVVNFIARAQARVR